MAIATTDIKTRLTTTAGSQGNALVQADPNLSLGLYVSQTDWLGDGTLNALFDNVSGLENTDSEADYRAIAIYNAHGSLPLTGVVIWLSSEVSGGTNVAIGVDPTAASPVNDTDPQALTIVDENTAPVGVSFSSPTTQGAGISLGDIPAGQVRCYWIRRTANNTTPVNVDGATFSISGDTAA
jgi:hypothetical protein